MRREYRGECHCGALQVHFHTALAPSAWSVRACQCRFCRAHGALTTSDPAGSLSLLAADESQLQRYRFGLHSADYWVCRRCGVYVGAVMSDAAFGIVNVRTLQPALEDLPDAVAMSYEGESREVRRARRLERWTPLGMEAG